MCLPVDYAFAEGRDGDVLGQVLADGRVVDAAGTVAGFVQPDGTVRSADGVRVGSARRGVAVRSADGRLAAVVSEQGYVKGVDGGAAMDGAQMSADGVLRAADGKVLGVALAPAPVPDAVVRCDPRSHTTCMLSSTPDCLTARMFAVVVPAIGSSVVPQTWPYLKLVRGASAAALLFLFFGCLCSNLTLGMSPPHAWAQRCVLALKVSGRLARADSLIRCDSTEGFAWPRGIVMGECETQTLHTASEAHAFISEIY